MCELMHETLTIIGRNRGLFDQDLERAASELAGRVADSSFLVLGGAGTIGQAVVKELFQRKPRRLHVVDVSENHLVELVRDIRSSLGYIEGDFRTLSLDCCGKEFWAFLDSQEPYDYVLNLSALKHVRSEKDPYTLMRMINVNVLNTERSLRHAEKTGTQKYFGVSTDKSVNPTSAMGASKRVMELCLMRAGRRLAVSTARFANVAFSDGSLLHGFLQRVRKKQPISAPWDVQRYFISAQESGQLCLMSCLLGHNRDLFFPKPCDELQPTRFDTIAERFLQSLGYDPHVCETEDEARSRVAELAVRNQWPCYFFESDTTGEKDLEEFYTDADIVDWERFAGVAVIKSSEPKGDEVLDAFLARIRSLREDGDWTREDILDALRAAVPNFTHKETHKYLDDRM